MIEDGRKSLSCLRCLGVRVPHVKWVVHQMWIKAPVLRAEFVAPALALWGNRAAAEMAVYTYYSGM